MKNLMKKIWMIIMIIAVMGLNISPALSLDTPDLEEDFGISADDACFDDWETFISAAVSYDSFKEFWKDMFVRYNKNICHYMDISNILKQIDAVREQIKKNFLSCNAEQAIQLTQKYYELEAELYFLRNFIDIPNSEIQEIADDRVFSEFRSTFYLNKKYFDDETIKTLFDKLKEKYKTKVSTTYAKCEDPGFATLKKKWDSFVENIKAMGTQGGSIKSNWGKPNLTPPKGMTGFIQGIENFRLNNLPAMKTPDQVIADLQKDSTSIAITDAHNAVVKTQQDYSTKVTSTSIKAEYEALYKKGGDQVAADYAAKIQEIIAIVESTYEPFTKLKKCASKSAERQCQ
ncbi:hypothetical protein ACFL10_02260 [Patescibacteria group bacterium]